MHIVKAFEKTQENRNEVTKELTSLMMDLSTKKDPESRELLERIMKIQKQVGAMLDPLVE